MGAVLWTVFSTTEYPPSEAELAAIRARKFDWTLGLGDIFVLVFNLPRRMWELGLVQFFTWIGMFSLWVYFSPAVAKDIFHAAPGSPEMEAAGAWSGFCFAAYNVVCFVFSFVLLWATKYTGPKMDARSLSGRGRARAGRRATGRGKESIADCHDRGGHCLGEHPLHALRHARAGAAQGQGRRA